MATKVKTGPCVNAKIDERTGGVLVECRHRGRTPMIEEEVLGTTLRVRGMCEGCVHDIEMEAAVEEAERRTARLDELAPPRMRKWDIDSWGEGVPQSALTLRDLAIGWAADFRAGGRRNLIMHGGVGSGKTGLAWSLLRACVQVDGLLDVDFVNFRDYLEEMKRTFDGNKEVDERPMRRALLVLDDLGAERPTEWALGVLARLVEHRYVNRLPTIVTTNYSPTELVDRLGRDELVVGERIVSRLTQDAVQLRFTGRDRRIA